MLTDWIPLTRSAELPAVSGLYIIRHRPSGKEYIGQSGNIRKRMREHRRASLKTSLLYRAIRKHGMADFDVCVYLVAELSELGDLEILLIAERKTFGSGYNSTEGGDGVRQSSWTPEARERMAEKLRGRSPSHETRERLRVAAIANNPGRGVAKSPEQIAKASDSLRRTYAAMPDRRKSEETRARMVIAAKSRGSRGPQTEQANFKRSLQLKGRTRPDRAAAARAVLVWEQEALLPKVFETAVAAAAHYGCHPTHLRQWAAGNITPRSGLVFAYQE